MARGRMINQSIATDKRLNSISLEAQLVYLMTIPHLDRDGLILGEPNMLASQVCPRRPMLRGEMQDIIGEWVASQLVIMYDGKEDPILFFVGFAKNQGGMRYDREAPSEFEPPPGYIRTDTGLVLEEISASMHNSGTTPAEVRQDSGTTPLARGRARLEVNVREEKRIGGGAPPPQTPRTRTDIARQQSAKHMRRDYPNVNARLLTELTNHVKRIHGFSALIEKPGTDDLEDKLRDEAYQLWQLGFTSDEQMSRLAIAWRDRSAGFKDKRPYGDQLYQEAVRLMSGESDDNAAPSIVDFVVGGLT